MSLEVEFPEFSKELSSDSIKVYDDVFPIDLLESIKKYALESHRWGVRLEKTYHWALGLIGYPVGHGVPGFEELAEADWKERHSDLPALVELWELLKDRSPVGKRLRPRPTRVLVNGAVSAHDGYAHTDALSLPSEGLLGHALYTHIIYLNKNWNIDMGGAVEFYNVERTEIIKSVSPKFGRMVVFDSRIPHAGKSTCKFFQGIRMNLTLQCKTTDIAYNDPAKDPTGGLVVERNKKDNK